MPDPRPLDPVGPKDEKIDDRDQCIRCPSPPVPDLSAMWWWWWLPLLSLLALILSIIALLLALRRRDEPEETRAADTAVPVPLPQSGKRWPGEGGAAAAAVLPGPSGDGAAAYRSALLDFFDARSEELRRVLCTLARMGVAWRRAEPERARGFMERIETHPFYKGGQVVFDLLEWEDFMLDGEAAAADSREVGLFIAQLAGWLGLPAPDAVVAGELPPLEPGFYLYRDVVLGGLAAAIATFPDPAET